MPVKLSLKARTPFLTLAQRSCCTDFDKASGFGKAVETLTNYLARYWLVSPE